MTQAAHENVPLAPSQVHYSANALVSALAAGAKKYKGVDERPIETLLCLALNMNSWLGPEFFGFPKGLQYRTQNISGLADVAGFSPETDWVKGMTPVAQIELKRDAQMNFSESKGYQLDWYAKNHIHSDHLVVLLPGFKLRPFQRDMDKHVHHSEWWQVITYETILEALTDHGVAELEAGPTRTLVLTMIRAQNIG
ncbi:hypothetical protein [Arthrobacter sp. GMC3]|uniref:hypothetical protein n=1 Tax=Arthrobacter sp. GMC3 TaxID=2058894 RepID=UPI000CE45957|nr:hypothetical protein [Arthrobacter sp. GMC3]